MKAERVIAMVDSQGYLACIACAEARWDEERRHTSNPVWARSGFPSDVCDCCEKAVVCK